MTNDLISRSALIKQLELLAKHEDGWRRNCIHGVVHTISTAPAVDAVEVVRCKDCKHWKKLKDDKGFCKQETFTLDDDDVDPLTVEDDFCSYGERRYDDVEP